LKLANNIGAWAKRASKHENRVLVGIENAGGKIGSIVGFQFGDYIVIKANGLGYSTFSVGGLIAYTRLK
jgi:hypothetical protein